MKKYFNHFITLMINGEIPSTIRTFPNPNYCKKEDYENIKKYLEIEKEKNPDATIYPVEIKELDLDKLIE